MRAQHGGRESPQSSAERRDAIPKAILPALPSKSELGSKAFRKQRDAGRASGEQQQTSRRSREKRVINSLRFIADLNRAAVHHAVEVCPEVIVRRGNDAFRNAEQFRNSQIVGVILFAILP